MSKANLLPMDKLDPAVEWAAWRPTAEQAWDAKWAAHLYRRAGFGPSRFEMREAVRLGVDATVAKLFDTPKEPVQRPSAISGPPGTNPRTGMPDASRHAAQLRAGWLQRMIDGREPLREKMALFWHNHFATSIKKVNSGTLMEKQGNLFFDHGLGSFRKMLGDDQPRSGDVDLARLQSKR